MGAPELPREPRGFGPRPAEAVLAAVPEPPAPPPEPFWLPRFEREVDEPPPAVELPGVAGCPPTPVESDDEGLPLLAGEPEFDPPPRVVLIGGTETLGVLTDGVLMLGVVTCGVVTGPTVTDGVVTEGVVIEGTETAGTETAGTETVGTLTVGTDRVGPAAVAAAAAIAGTTNATETTRTRNRIRLMTRAIEHPTTY